MCRVIKENYNIKNNLMKEIKYLKEKLYECDDKQEALKLSQTLDKLILKYMNNNGEE